MRDLDSSEVTLIRIACEVIDELGGEAFPVEFFSLPPDVVATRLSAAYQGEFLCDVMQCRGVVERAMAKLS